MATAVTWGMLGNIVGIVFAATFRYLVSMVLRYRRNCRGIPSRRWSQPDLCRHPRADAGCCVRIHSQTVW